MGAFLFFLRSPKSAGFHSAVCHIYHIEHETDVLHTTKGTHMQRHV